MPRRIQKNSCNNTFVRGAGRDESDEIVIQRVRLRFHVHPLIGGTMNYVRSVAADQSMLYVVRLLMRDDRLVNKGYPLAPKFHYTIYIVSANSPRRINERKRLL